MYRLFWIDRERENQVKLFEDERFKTHFDSVQEGLDFLINPENYYQLPKTEYVILPYFKIH